MSVSYESLHPTDEFSGNIVTSGTIHTKGSYLQFDASTAFTVEALWLCIRYFGSSGRYLVDIATGAGGAETVKIADILMQGNVETGLGGFFIPFNIASGTRIALRGQRGTSGAGTLFLVLHIIAGDGAGILSGAIAHTYGADTATTNGVEVDSGAVSVTKGSYAQLTAATSTTDPLYWLLVCIAAQNTGSVAAFMFDIATGAGGAETVIVPDRQLTTVSSTTLNAWQSLPVNIANGTRIAVRSLSGTTGSPDRKNNFVLVGIEGTLNVGGGGGGGGLMRPVAQSGGLV